MIQPKTKFRFSVQNHDFWQALEGSNHFMPPPYQRAQYDIPTKERLTGGGGFHHPPCKIHKVGAHVM